MVSYNRRCIVHSKTGFQTPSLLSWHLFMLMSPCALLRRLSSNRRWKCIMESPFLVVNPNSFNTSFATHLHSIWFLFFYNHTRPLESIANYFYTCLNSNNHLNPTDYAFPYLDSSGIWVEPTPSYHPTNDQKEINITLIVSFYETQLTKSSRLRKLLNLVTSIKHDLN